MNVAMNWIEWAVREVGELTADDVLVRGTLTVSAALAALSMAGWRVLRRKRETKPMLDRVKIDAPNNVRIKVEPVEREEN